MAETEKHGLNYGEGDHMNFSNWRRIETVKVKEGITHQVFTGDNVMLCYNIIQPGIHADLHSHPHEQLLTIEQGECIVALGEEKIHMGAGDMLQVPPNVVHDLTVVGDVEVHNIDVFTPIREDYL